MGNKHSRGYDPNVRATIVSGEATLDASSPRDQQPQSIYTVTVETSSAKGFGIDEKGAWVSILLYGDGDFARDHRDKQEMATDEEESVYIIGRNHKLTQTNVVKSSSGSQISPESSKSQ